MSTQTKERPILFSASMILAILDGKKTQTRRIIKKQPSTGLYIQAMHGRSPDGIEFGDKTHWRIAGPDYPDNSEDDIYCPFGVPGDRLWVREEHYCFGHWEPAGVKTKTGRMKWKFWTDLSDLDNVTFDAPETFRKGRHNKDPETSAWHKRLARFMPKTISRITLEITGVRVERLQDISEDDALAEGSYLDRCPCLPRRKDKTPFQVMFSQTGCHIHGTEFKALWESINGKGSWKRNDWLWVIEFRKL